MVHLHKYEEAQRSNGKQGNPKNLISERTTLILLLWDGQPHGLGMTPIAMTKWKRFFRSPYKLKRVTA